MSLVHFAVLALTGFEAAHTMTWTSGELTPWPMPASVSNGTDSLRVSAADVEITTECPSQILERAIQRYKTVIAQGSPPTPVPDAAVVRSRAATKVALSVSVEDASEELGDETDESYKLDFLADGSAQVSAKTVFGALKGLESFSQLFETTSDGDLLVRGLPWSVSDSPRFAHRGMLIDSSRHFLELDTIRNHVDSMAMSKLNVLHWHLVDFQSFPFNSSAAPRLVLGAFSPRESYSPDDVRSIVTYAKDRGVRVVIEVDTPGHSQSWGRGYPDVITSCPKTIAAKGGGYAIMDPTVNATYDVLSKVLSELGSIATDPVFHLGGDEVRKDCWSESASIRAFMEQKGFGTDFSLLENYYEQRLLEVAAKAMPNRTLMVYQEVFDNNISLPGRVIFDVWRSHNAAPIPDEVAAIVRSGHRVVVSNGNQGNWYLNLGWGNGAVRQSWVDVYSLDPLNGTEGVLTPAETELIVGGEASLWGEEIDNTNLASKAWPRGAAFAERMWSPREATPSTKRGLSLTGPRLARIVCKMRARGLTASPLSPGSCYAKNDKLML